MRVITAPHYPLEQREEDIKFFLAGSIEMGKAEEWQKEFIDTLKVIERKFAGNHTIYENFKKLSVYNPRREEWNPDWEQTMDNPHLSQQINWELDGLERADYILFYFAPGTLSPVTLYELGMYGARPKVYVVCSKDYLRAGNVEIACYRRNIPMFRTIEEALDRFTQDFFRR